MIELRKIAVLDQNTIDKIAAGEVVERPASVVKELVENAIDAGSSAITVEIKEGGISFIRVTDNGGGMVREQVPLAFLRHATSKIEKVEDLMRISSLGFRGEALSSIAAVGQVELITKTPEALTGVLSHRRRKRKVSGGDRRALRHYHNCPQPVFQHAGQGKILKDSHDRSRLCEFLYGTARSVPSGHLF